MATEMQKSNHITSVRNSVDTWLSAQNALLALRREWDALGLSAALTPADFVGENAGLTPAEISAVYTTLDAEMSMMAAGHSTNLHQVAH
jgi:hypothetical protein